MQKLPDIFYTDDRLLAVSRLARLQESLDVLMGLFYWVGLRVNINKTVGMVCQICRNSGIQSELAYTRRMMED